MTEPKTPKEIIENCMANLSSINSTIQAIDELCASKITLEVTVFINTYLIPTIDEHWTDSKMRNDLYAMVNEAEKNYKEMEGD